MERVTAAERSVAADPTPEYAALEARVSESLRTSAGLVAHEVEDGDGLAALTAARDAHSAALERLGGRGAAEGAARPASSTGSPRPFRCAASRSPPCRSPTRPTRPGMTRCARAAGEAAVKSGSAILRAHCNVRSVRFRNAARAGLGLALAVLVAKTTSVEHAFWVVLAALSVLRSNALGTGATALQALAGALVGFGIAAALIETVGGDDTWLWIVLPFVVFLAGYTPGAVNYVVGQAGFTVFVVVLFDILVPAGWRTGLVRVQDIAIGAGISVAVGALLWPRGARGVARRSFAELLRAGTVHLLARARCLPARTDW